jgi:hypothetical protein
VPPAGFAIDASVLPSASRTLEAIQVTPSAASTWKTSVPVRPEPTRTSGVFAPGHATTTKLPAVGFELPPVPSCALIVADEVMASGAVFASMLAALALPVSCFALVAMS